MNGSSYHYNHTLAVLTACGIDEDAAAMAAAVSHYVNDCIDGTPFRVGRQWKIPVQTQSYAHRESPLVQRLILLPFHYLPGANIESIQRQKNPFVVRRNSMIARSIVKQAIAVRDPYWLGIAIHAYLDTYSHEGSNAFDGAVAGEVFPDEETQESAAYGLAGFFLPHPRNARYPIQRLRREGLFRGYQDAGNPCDHWRKEAEEIDSIKYRFTDYACFQAAAQRHFRFFADQMKGHYMEVARI